MLYWLPCACVEMPPIHGITPAHLHSIETLCASEKYLWSSSVMIAVCINWICPPAKSTDIHRHSQGVQDLGPPLRWSPFRTLSLNPNPYSNTWQQMPGMADLRNGRPLEWRAVIRGCSAPHQGDKKNFLLNFLGSGLSAPPEGDITFRRRLKFLAFRW